jgi:tetratricopeptide (TPR) repeat protein
VYKTIVLQFSKNPLPKAEPDDYLVLIVESPKYSTPPESFKLNDLEEVIEGKTLQDVRQDLIEEDPEPAVIENLGEFLFEKAFQPKIANKFQQIRTRFKNGRYRYRFCLKIAEDAPYLETLPWEYLRRWKAHPHIGWLARRFASITRSLDERDPPRFSRPAQIKMLLAYANPEVSSPNGIKIERAAEDFFQRFKSTTGTMPNVQLDLNWKVTKNDFQKALSKNHYDIVHFIGHGYVKLSDSNGYIRFEDDEINGEGIVERLLPQAPPKLFYFNSCSTARADVFDAFSSLAQVLIKNDKSPVPAVIAMQYDISVDDSLRMAEVFYGHLLDQGSAFYGDIDAAMDEARFAINEDNHSWGIPMLFLQTHEPYRPFGAHPGGRLRGGGGQPLISFHHLHSVLPSLPPAAFDNRAEEIGAVSEVLDSGDTPLLVYGRAGIGRATVVRAAIERSLWSGATILWIDLRSVKNEDATLATLYLSINNILDGDLKPLWHQSHQELTYRFEELEKLIPENSVLVLENMDGFLERGIEFTVEAFLFELSSSSKNISIVATALSDWELSGEHTGWRCLKLEGLNHQDAFALLHNEVAEKDDEMFWHLPAAVKGHPYILKLLASAITKGQTTWKEIQSTLPPSPGETHGSTISSVLGLILSPAERKYVERWSVFRHPVSRDALLFYEKDEALETMIQSFLDRSIIREQEGYLYLPLPLKNVMSGDLAGQLDKHLNVHLHAAQFFSFISTGLPETETINSMLEMHYHLRAADRTGLAYGIAGTLFQSLVDQNRYSDLNTLVQQTLQDGINDFSVQLFDVRRNWLNGRYDSALEKLSRMLQFVASGSFDYAVILTEMGIVLKERARSEDAEEMMVLFEKAFKLFDDIKEQSENPFTSARCLRGQAETRYSQGLVCQYHRRVTSTEKIDTASQQTRNLYQDSLDIYSSPEARIDGWKICDAGKAKALKQLGELYLEQPGKFSTERQFEERDKALAERLAQAEQVLNEAIEITRHLESPSLEVTINYERAKVARQQGRIKKARRIFSNVAELAGNIGAVATQARAEVQIAEIDFQDGLYSFRRLNARLDWCEEKLSYFGDAHSIRVQADAFYLQALLWLEQVHLPGYLERAKSLLSKTLETIGQLTEEYQTTKDRQRSQNASNGLEWIRTKKRKQIQLRRNLVEIEPEQVYESVAHEENHPEATEMN